MLEFSAIIATDTRLFVTDRPGGPCHEILLPSGCRFNRKVELRSTHQGGDEKIIGHMMRSWQVGEAWLAKFVIDANTQLARDMAARIRRHDLSAVSAGYRVPRSSVIHLRPWSKINLAGRAYTSGENTVEVITRYFVHEVTIAESPVDPDCTIFHAEDVNEDRGEVATVDQSQPKRKLHAYGRFAPSAPTAPGPIAMQLTTR